MNQAVAEGAGMIRRILGRGKVRRTISRLLRRGVNFNDARGRRVVLLPHCALNQNSRVAGAAHRPAAMENLIAGLLQHNIGIIQMPCPELILLGLDRAHLPISAESRRPSHGPIAPPGFRPGRANHCLPEIWRGSARYSGQKRVAHVRRRTTWRRGVVSGTGAFIEGNARTAEKSRLKVKIIGIEDDNPEAVLSKLEGL